LWHVRHAGPPGDPLSRYSMAEPKRPYVLEGRVRRPDLPGGDYTQFLLDVDQVRLDGHLIALAGGVRVSWSDPGQAVYADDRVRVRGVPDQALGRVNPGIQDYEDFLRRRGVHSTVKIRGPDAVERIAPGRWWRPSHWASRLRAFEASRLRRAIPASARALAFTIWLGDRRGMRASEYQSYVTSGTAHILAVSGVHMGVVFISVSFLLRFLVRNRRVRAGLTIGAVLLFALVAGARVSALRAATMIALYLLADLFDREPDAPNALGLAGILFLLVNPEVLFDRAFLLSFSSVASILLFREPVSTVLASAPRMVRDGLAAVSARLRRGLPDAGVPSSDPVPRGVHGGLATPLAVQILPLPLAVHFFHVLPLVGPLANLIVVPLLTAALWLCFLTTLCAVVSTDVATLFGHALAVVVDVIHALVRVAAAAPGGHTRLASPTTVAMAAYWGMVASVTIAVRVPTQRRRRWVAGAVVLAAVAALSWRPWHPPSEVVFLDVGHGDAAFIRTPGGDTVLIDGGDANDRVDMGARVVAPFLWSRHVDRIDYVILSHPDQDHIGGLAYILDQFPVGQLLLGPADTGRRAEWALLEQCADKGIPVRRVARGTTLHLAGAALDILHPPVGCRSATTSMTPRWCAGWSGPGRTCCSRATSKPGPKAPSSPSWTPCPSSKSPTTARGPRVPGPSSRPSVPGSASSRPGPPVAGNPPIRACCRPTERRA